MRGSLILALATALVVLSQLHVASSAEVTYIELSEELPVNKDNRDAVVISLGDIATITIPPNAMLTKAMIKAMTVVPADVILPKEDVNRTSNIVKLTPHGKTFGSDIDIAIKVVNGDKSGCETFDIMRKADDVATWEKITPVRDCSAYNDTGFVSFKSSSFSYYALRAPPALSCGAEGDPCDGEPLNTAAIIGIIAGSVGGVGSIAATLKKTYKYWPAWMKRGQPEDPEDPENPEKIAPAAADNTQMQQPGQPPQMAGFGMHPTGMQQPMQMMDPGMQQPMQMMNPGMQQPMQMMDPGMQYSVQPMGYPQSGGQLGYLQPGSPYMPPQY